MVVVPTSEEYVISDGDGPCKNHGLREVGALFPLELGLGVQEMSLYRITRALIQDSQQHTSIWMFQCLFF